MSFMKLAMLAMLGTAVSLSGCGTDKNVNRAKMSASKYWTDKAAPGKAFDVQVTEATKDGDGKYRVKAIVDGQQRVGVYNPANESFDEGFYTLSYERGKKIAELEEENRYLKDSLEKKEKELYQLKLRLKYMRAGKGDPNEVTDSDVSSDDADDEVRKPVKKAKKESDE